MADQKQDRLLEHEYDGIQEYDNPMPRWWLIVFFVTILLVPVYYVVPFGAKSTNVAEYEADVAAWRAAHPTPTALAMLADSDYVAMSRRTDAMNEGKTLFVTNCASCHRADGGGAIGPNLADAYWIHGGAPSQIRTTIEQGVPAKGMIAWGIILKPDQMDLLTAYVLSLRGSNPPSPKAPEGTVAPPAS